MFKFLDENPKAIKQFIGRYKFMLKRFSFATDKINPILEKLEVKLKSQN